MTTTTKTRKIDTLRPPRDIRDNTKARREWLAVEAAKVNAQPNRLAKIVGTGSYQEVSVYEVVEVAARTQTLGTCQFCGNLQCLDKTGRLVMHGYSRPGWGYTVGRCPGVGYLPLQHETTETEAWMFQWGATRYEAEGDVVTTEQRLHEAKNDLYRDDNTERGAVMARPHRLHRSATPEQVLEYTKAMDAWRVRFPLTAAVEMLTLQLNTRKQDAYKAKGIQQHLQGLLNSGTFGQALVTRVVEG